MQWCIIHPLQAEKSQEKLNNFTFPLELFSKCETNDHLKFRIKRQTKQRFFVVIELFFVMGLTWIAEIVRNLNDQIFKDQNPHIVFFIYKFIHFFFRFCSVWTRIYWSRIRIQIFFLTKNSDFLDKKMQFIYFFACLKDLKLQAKHLTPRENIQHLKKWNLYSNLVEFTYLDTDLDPDLGFSPGQKYFFSSFKFFRASWAIAWGMGKRHVWSSTIVFDVANALQVSRLCLRRQSQEISLLKMN